MCDIYLRHAPMSSLNPGSECSAAADDNYERDDWPQSLLHEGRAYVLIETPHADR